MAKEEGVVAASSALDERIDGSAHRGTPKAIRLSIIPIDDDKSWGSAENNTEIGIGVEKPFAGKSRIGNAGLAGAKAELEVLGARFERQNLDAKGKPEESSSEAGLAGKCGVRHRDRG